MSIIFPNEIINALKMLGFQLTKVSQFEKKLSEESACQIKFSLISGTKLEAVVYPIISILYPELGGAGLEIFPKSHFALEDAAVSRPLSYLLPEPKYRDWGFAHKADCESFVDAIAVYAMRFFNEYSSVDSLLTEFENASQEKRATNFNCLEHLILPLAHIYKKNYAEATAVIQRIGGESPFDDYFLRYINRVTH
jgi:hypothetical protein